MSNSKYTNGNINYPSVIQSLIDRLAYLEAKEAKVTHETGPRMSLNDAVPEERRVSEPLAHSSTVGLYTSHVPSCEEETAPMAALSDDTGTYLGSDAPNQDGSTINAMCISDRAADTSTDTSSQFYGEPSATSLLCDIQDHYHRPSKLGACREHPFPPPFLSSPRSLSTSYPSDKDDYHLPPRYVADNLIALYRDRVQSIYPFLHWPTFIAAYNRLWLSNSDVDSMPQLTGVGLGGPHCSAAVFYCALNAAFALATQFIDTAAQDRDESSAPFVRRSRHLMRLEFLDTADLSMVQALLILARYLQTTSIPSRCWHVAGIAYRMAQSLGLHLRMDKRATSAVELEMRRRVWHSCSCIDTYENLFHELQCCSC